MRPITNEIGNIYGDLTVIKLVMYKKGSCPKWECLCKCGNITIARVDSLRDGSFRSCGCSRTKHGMAGTAVYRSWQQMINRCYNKTHISYINYGKRGIKVCIRWHKFENFLKDMGARSVNISLDRIDNTKNYNRNNCKWSTKKEQARNRRSNKLITYNNKTQCLIEWCEELKMSYSRIYNRIFKYNWTPKEAFEL